MKRAILAMALTAAVALWAAAPAQAIGVGGYVDLAGGSGEFEEEDGLDFDVDATSAGIGFAMDTSVRDRSSFNYRLHVGLEALTLTDDADQEFRLGGLVFDNTFGFALIRKPNFRLWAGPQIRIGFYSGELEEIDDSSDTLDYEASLFAFGVGGVVGANFAVGSNFNICPSIGLRWTGYSGTYERTTTTTDDEGDLNGGTGVFFIGVDFLFGAD